MKKLYIINICLILIIVLTAGIIKLQQNKEETVKELLSDRIDILNGYYKGNTSVSETYDSLKTVEYGKVLHEDTAYLDAYAGTDIDQIIEYEIKDFTWKESDYGYIEGKAEFQWLMESNTDKYVTKLTYSYRCNEINGKYKITEFKIIT